MKRVNALVPTSPDTARRAGELMGAAGTDDAVDAIVVAEALASISAVVTTSDADDIRRLLGSLTGRAWPSCAFDRRGRRVRWRPLGA